MKRDHTIIKQALIEASYDAISHLESVLKEKILNGDIEDLSPDKFMNAVKAKKQAQMDAFEMLSNIERAQSEIDSLSKKKSAKEKTINNHRGGFPESM